MERIDCCEMIRDKARELANFIYDVCPRSEERDRVLAKIEETVAMANALAGKVQFKVQSAKAKCQEGAPEKAGAPF